MASLGDELITKILGHSAAEKAFRPWWDNLEDFLLYSLVMLGLIVAPTAIINGTPLDCNLCTHHKCIQNLKPSNATKQINPGFNAWWVKKYCTMTAVDGFILYFPYLLLSIALALVLIERIFLRIFRAGLKLNAFYSLVQKTLEEPEEDFTSFKQEYENSTKNKTAIEVLYSFNSTSNYFRSYLIRSILVTIISSTLLIWLVLMGIPSMNRDKFIHCNIHGYFYECAGHPQQFYMYVLFVTLIIIVVYIFCCLFNLVWLLTPQFGRLSRVMRQYRSMLSEHNDENEDPLGDLDWIYFKNKDLKLLLDLLATSSGVSQSISLLTLFDQNLRQKCIPSQLSVTRIGDTATVEVGEAEAIKKLFSKMYNFTCVYTVQIHPSCMKSSLRVLKFESKKRLKAKKDDIEMQAFQKSLEVKHVSFKNLLVGEEYAFLISTLVNGHCIAKKMIK